MSSPELTGTITQPWQPIDTLPENTYALVWLEYPAGEAPCIVDKFIWRVREVEDEMADMRTPEGYKVRRYMVQEVREREWRDGGWGATHWMPLPNPPHSTGGSV
jgi:hypothetical protein